ncbi:MAG: zinc ribbon domain-containing protein [Acidimicrobiia bacterium]|nr:zinc ribbon domain-containing protein [Acidimicrobiia bacterium]
MALVDCPECGHQISTLAAACPQCGYPIQAEAALLAEARPSRGPSRWTDPGFWIILVGLIIVIVMSVLILRHTEDGAPEDTTSTTTVGAPAWVI